MGVKNKKTTECKVCGAIIAKSAPTCPQCGAKRKRGIGRIIIGIVVLIFGLALMISSFSDADGKAKTSNAVNGQNAVQAINNSNAAKRLEEIAKPEIAFDEFGLSSIKGSYKNISGKTLSYAQVTFALYDDEGAQIGTAVANINNLTADSVWKYSAVALTTEEWTSFELTEVDAW